MKPVDKDPNFSLPNHLGSFTSLSPYSSEFEGSDSDEEPERDRRDRLMELQDIIPVRAYSPLPPQKIDPKNHSKTLFASAMTIAAGSKLLLTGYSKGEPAVTFAGAGIVSAGFLVMYNLYSNPQPARVTTKRSISYAARRTPTPT